MGASEDVPVHLFRLIKYTPHPRFPHLLNSLMKILHVNHKQWTQIHIFLHKLSFTCIFVNAYQLMRGFTNECLSKKCLYAWSILTYPSLYWNDQYFSFVYVTSVQYNEKIDLGTCAPGFGATSVETIDFLVQTLSIMLLIISQIF